jgi:hypothetical protein
MTMPFHEEPHGYTYTALSDLQGAWENLRDEVAKAHPFAESERILFHINEGMSWESVRDLDRMAKALLVIRNLVAQNDVPEDVAMSLEDVVENFDELKKALADGEKL